MLFFYSDNRSAKKNINLGKCVLIPLFSKYIKNVVHKLKTVLYCIIIHTGKRATFFRILRAKKCVCAHVLEYGPIYSHFRISLAVKSRINFHARVKFTSSINLTNFGVKLRTNLKHFEL